MGLRKNKAVTPSTSHEFISLAEQAIIDAKVHADSAVEKATVEQAEATEAAQIFVNSAKEANDRLNYAASLAKALPVE